MTLRLTAIERVKAVGRLTVGDPKNVVANAFGVHPAIVPLRL